MQSVHMILADAAVLAVVVAIAWSCVLTVTARPGGRGFERWQAIVVLVVILAAVSGAAQLASGARPQDGLHLVYGGVAIVLLPLARSFRTGARRRDTLLLLVAVITLGGVMYRLFATG
jgi:hypothetical protein